MADEILLIKLRSSIEFDQNWSTLVEFYKDIVIKIVKWHVSSRKQNF